MRNLTYEFFNGELSTHHIPFFNTQHFSPVLSVDIHCRYIVLKFDQLISLTAISAVPNEHCVIQLQSLLDRASHLSQLHTEWIWDKTLEKVLFEIKSVSIYHLSLLSNDLWFNIEECVKLSHTPLRIQCEILMIDVEN